MKPAPIHWAGGGVIANDRTKRNSHYGRGFPICCSGERAVSVARNGWLTYYRESVTCKSCLLQLGRIDFTKHVHGEIPNMFRSGP